MHYVFDLMMFMLLSVFWIFRREREKKNVDDILFIDDHQNGDKVSNGG